MDVSILQYLYILSNIGTYHATLLLLERICMQSLTANPILVLNVDCTEKLELHVHLRHVFQPLQRLLKVMRVKLSVRTVRGRKLEMRYPSWVIIYNKVNELLRQITQTGKKAEHNVSDRLVAAVHARSSMERPRLPR